MRILVYSIRIGLCFTLLAISASSSFPRNQICRDGKLNGTVADQQDAVIPKALVTIKNKYISKTLFTNQEGQFETMLLPGKYEVTVEANGFKNYRRKNIVIQDSQTVTLTMTMKNI